MLTVAAELCVMGCYLLRCSNRERERLVLLVAIDSQIIGLLGAPTKVIFHTRDDLLPAHICELTVCLREHENTISAGATIKHEWACEMIMHGLATERMWT